MVVTPALMHIPAIGPETLEQVRRLVPLVAAAFVLSVMLLTVVLPRRYAAVGVVTFCLLTTIIGGWLLRRT